MGRIFLSSDLHFGHNREFLYKPRGFNSIEEHDTYIINNWNKTINPEDTVWILGDLMLGNNAYGIDCLNQLNGNLNICIGNHDTNSRIALYSQIKSIQSIQYATILRYKKFRFYLSHYPTMTANLEKEHLFECLINLFGHTHSKEKFYNNIPFMYNVSLDANNNMPIEIDDIINKCKTELQKYKKEKNQEQ